MKRNFKIGMKVVVKRIAFDQNSEFGSLSGVYYGNELILKERGAVVVDVPHYSECVYVRMDADGETWVVDPSELRLPRKHEH